MRYKSILLLISLSLLICGCQATSKALQKPVADEYIEVVQDDPTIDVEEALKNSNKDYVCKEIIYTQGAVKSRRACFIKAPPKGALTKLGIKLADVPEAIVEDTGKTILVVGKVVMTALFDGALNGLWR